MLKYSLCKDRIKLLISDTAPLYPPLWGGPKRIWNLYGNFSQDLFDITYGGVDCKKGGDLRYSFQKIRDNFKEILCFLPPYYYPVHAFEKLVIGEKTLDLFVYLRMHADWQFRHVLNMGNPDMVICSHPWSVFGVQKKRDSFFIYDAHNCEYVLMEQILQGLLFKNAVLRQVRKIEGEACRRSAFMLVCSQKEKNEFVDIYGVNPDKIMIVPNGTNLPLAGDQKMKQHARRKLGLSAAESIAVFIGAYYKPNNDAVGMIIDTIAKDAPEVKFLIVGTVSEALKGREVPLNVRIMGRLSEEDLDSVLRAADIGVNPMRKGSGVNIKMLDYMAYGLPVVATECGARGIETEGRQVIVVSSIDNFAQAIKGLCENRELAARMGQESRDLVSKRYTWKLISSALEEEIIHRFKR